MSHQNVLTGDVEEGSMHGRPSGRRSRQIELLSVFALLGVVSAAVAYRRDIWSYLTRHGRGNKDTETVPVTYHGLPSAKFMDPVETRPVPVSDMSQGSRRFIDAAGEAPPPEFYH